jgi:hypothetical protein
MHIRSFIVFVEEYLVSHPCLLISSSVWNWIYGTLRIKLAQEEAFVVHDSSCRIHKTRYSYVIKKASTVLAELGRSSYWEWYQESLKHTLITEDYFVNWWLVDNFLRFHVCNIYLVFFVHVQCNSMTCKWGWPFDRWAQKEGLRCISHCNYLFLEYGRTEEKTYGSTVNSECYYCSLVDVTWQSSKFVPAFLKELAVSVFRVEVISPTLLPLYQDAKHHIQIVFFNICCENLKS